MNKVYVSTQIQGSLKAEICLSFQPESPLHPLHRAGTACPHPTPALSSLQGCLAQAGDRGGVEAAENVFTVQCQKAPPTDSTNAIEASSRARSLQGTPASPLSLLSGLKARPLALKATSSLYL